MTYQAIIAKIYTRPTPNADNLVLGDVLGFQVLVGKDIENGQLGVYFPTDGQLSRDFCEVHNLIGKTDPLTNKRTGGFFDEKRRVKTLKLRKEKSDGFWMPLSCLEFTGVDISILPEGYLFTEINGVEICKQYITQATKNAMKSQAKTKRVNKMFPQHVDTEQFAYNKQFIKPGALITMTAKAHGTSHRIANVEETVIEDELFIIQKADFQASGNFLKDLFFGIIHELKPRFIWEDVPTEKLKWTEVHGTRRVQLADIHSEGDGFYGMNFRDNATKQLQGRLKRGEVIYLEIVGWANDTPIMSPHTLDKKEQKELWGKYPETMYYSYGCLPGESKIFIYRITQNDPDGHVTELSWRQVQRRAEELGVPAVYEYCQFIYGQSDYAKTLPELEFIVNELAEKHPDPLDSRHIREGVVIRVDDISGTHFYKHKSFDFKVLEGIIKNDGEIFDIEEVESAMDNEVE